VIWLTLARAGQVDYRHPLPVRVWHWVNAAAVVVLLMTGLLIFDIHPLQRTEIERMTRNADLPVMRAYHDSSAGNAGRAIGRLSQRCVLMPHGMSASVKASPPT